MGKSFLRLLRDRRPLRRGAVSFLVAATLTGATAQDQGFPPAPAGAVLVEGRYAAEPILRVLAAAELGQIETP